ARPARIRGVLLQGDRDDHGASDRHGHVQPRPRETETEGKSRRRPFLSCERTSLVLHAYFDGELDAADVPEFERHLESCPDCAAALAVQETLRSSLKGSKLRERAPESLRRKLAAEI